MFFVRKTMMLMFGCIIFMARLYLCISGDKGLILGMWNPASYTTIKGIPKDQVSPFKNVTFKIDPSCSQITSLAADPKEAVVFAAIMDEIYIYHNFSIWQNRAKKFSILFKGKSAAIGQIAYDFVSRNLYWCDSMLSWIAMKPANSRTNKMYKVVIHKDLNQPVGLALNSEDRLMFFSDNGPNTRIEKASLDGQGRMVIVYSGISAVFSLTVDTGNNKLYWADHDRQTIETCDYDGLNRRVIRRLPGIPATDLCYHQNILHAVSPIEKKIFAVDITSGSVVYLHTSWSKPFAISVYDAESQGMLNGTDPCVSMNCQHMCANTQSGPKCVCFEGFDLDGNEKTCSDKYGFVERVFIVSNASMFAMHKVHPTGTTRSVFHSIQLPATVIETFAVDAKSDTIYFVDSKRNTLRKHDIFSLRTRTLGSISSATDLTYDWIENCLGWIEPTQSSIRSFSVNSLTMATIYTNLKQPESLTVDPHKGVIYWISGSPDRSIFRGSWTKEESTVLISTANLDKPSSLNYDVTSNRIYWLDRSLIKSSTTKGTDIIDHIITTGATNAFAYKNIFAWINGNKLHIKRATDISDEVLNTVQNSRKIAVIDSYLQQDRRGSCHVSNGGCGNICVPEEDGRKCDCDVGLQLQPDQSCASDVLTENFIVVTDFVHGRILQVDLKTGNIIKLSISVTNVPGLSFDKSSMTLFYSEISTKAITSTTLQGGNATHHYTLGYGFADRLAIDYSTGNIYYTALGPTTSQTFIGAVHRTTSVHKTIIYNLHNPRDIALYPSKGFLFWTEFGNTTKISRANMDGTSKVYIATTGLSLPNGLTIDFSSNRLYWTDGHSNQIESSDLSGGNRRVLAYDSDAHLMGIVSHGEYLFYTAWNRQRVTKMDKTTGLKVPFMANIPELGRLDSLDIYADEFRDVSPVCSRKNGFCSTFCFPTSIGRTCGCQDNVNLQSDQLTCEGITRCPTMLPNLNFLDCLPYPGQSCDFKCKTGYRLAVATTVSCGSVGQWIPSTDALCEAILCPSSLENAVLSPSCRRRIGDSCSFSCFDGYHRSTSESLVCSTDGNWNLDTNKLCSRPRCPNVLKNGQFINCQYNIGDSCSYKCNYPFEVNPSVKKLTCDKDGEWSHDTNDLCLKLCPSNIANGHLEANCERHIGNSCSFTCDTTYRSAIGTSNIICTTGGIWNEDAQQLCIPMKCPLNDRFISPTCQGLIGEKCDVTCGDDNLLSKAQIVCLSSGSWDTNARDVCIQNNQHEKNHTPENITSLYSGVIASVLVILITVLIVYLKK